MCFEIAQRLALMLCCLCLVACESTESDDFPDDSPIFGLKTPSILPRNRPNPFAGLPHVPCHTIAVATHVSATGKLHDVAWIQDPQLAQVLEQTIFGAKSLDVFRDFDWDSHLYVVMLDAHKNVIAAMRTGYGRDHFFPAEAIVSGHAICILKVDAPHWHGKLSSAEPCNHMWQYGIPALEVIHQIETKAKK